MPYNITCCNCKKEIPVKNGKTEMFFIVQPTMLKDFEWKRITYGGFKQLMICKKCILKRSRRRKRKKDGK